MKIISKGLAKRDDPMFTGGVKFSTRSKEPKKIDGVSFDEEAKKWSACAKIDGEEFYLGFFDTQEKAVAAIDAAKSIHGWKL